MKVIYSLPRTLLSQLKISRSTPIDSKRYLKTMSGAQEFPPRKVRDVVVDVAKLLKERGETVSVAETVSSPLFHLNFDIYIFWLRSVLWDELSLLLWPTFTRVVWSTTVAAYFDTRKGLEWGIDLEILGRCRRKEGNRGRKQVVRFDWWDYRQRVVSYRLLFSAHPVPVGYIKVDWLYVYSISIHPFTFPIASQLPSDTFSD